MKTGIILDLFFFTLLKPNASAVQANLEASWQCTSGRSRATPRIRAVLIAGSHRTFLPSVSCKRLLAILYRDASAGPSCRDRRFQPPVPGRKMLHLLQQQVCPVSLPHSRPHTTLSLSHRLLHSLLFLCLSVCLSHSHSHHFSFFLSFSLPGLTPHSASRTGSYTVFSFFVCLSVCLILILIIFLSFSLSLYVHAQATCKMLLQPC